MIIAIDGPSGAGKVDGREGRRQEARASRASTRGPCTAPVAWQAMQNGVPLDDDAALGRLRARLRHRVRPRSRATPFRGACPSAAYDVTDAIRTAEIDRAVSPVSAAPSVRAALVDQQRRIGRAGDYVVEGRDIGTVVFPEAEVKVFLTASDEERAHRRVRQNVDRGVGSIDYDEVLADLRRRDEHDSVARHRLLCARPTTPCASTPPTATSRT